MTLVRESLKQEAVESTKVAGIPVIIFGAGIVGEALLHACHKAGIEVECFCDNNINKTRSSRCKIDVIHMSNLRSRFDDAIFLIAAADIKDVVDQLRELGYSKWHAGTVFLRDFDFFQEHFDAPMEFVEFAVNTCIVCHDSYLNPDKLFLRSVDIIITERCSLKCRDCSNLMQYYKRPEDCSLQDVVQAIGAFCSFVDEVNEFRVIGGEPFMNKEIHLIIRKLIDEPKVHRIVIYTNGTIVPREEQIRYLRHSKVLFIITDYGTLSRRVDDLARILQGNGIAYYRVKARGWSDCSRIMRHCRSSEGQKEVFKSCCARNVVTLSNGKLYRCPFSANAARLMAVPEFGNDYVNILPLHPEDTDANKKRQSIRALLSEKEFLETCDYCDGRPFGAPEIEPAIQVDKPLEYELCGPQGPRTDQELPRVTD